MNGSQISQQQWVHQLPENSTVITSGVSPFGGALCVFMTPTGQVKGARYDGVTLNFCRVAGSMPQTLLGCSNEYIHNLRAVLQQSTYLTLQAGDIYVQGRLYGGGYGLSNLVTGVTGGASFALGFAINTASFGLAAPVGGFFMGAGGQMVAQAVTADAEDISFSAVGSQALRGGVSGALTGGASSLGTGVGVAARLAINGTASVIGNTAGSVAQAVVEGKDVGEALSASVQPTALATSFIAAGVGSTASSVGSGAANRATGALLGQAESKVAAVVAGAAQGAASGAAAGVATQGVSNIIQGRSLTEGMGGAALTGATVGSVAGAATSAKNFDETAGAKTKAPAPESQKGAVQPEPKADSRTLAEPSADRARLIQELCDSPDGRVVMKEGVRLQEGLYDLSGNRIDQSPRLITIHDPDSKPSPTPSRYFAGQSAQTHQRTPSGTTSGSNPQPPMETAAAAPAPAAAPRTSGGEASAAMARPEAVPPSTASSKPTAGGGGAAVLTKPSAQNAAAPATAPKASGGGATAVMAKPVPQAQTTTSVAVPAPAPTSSGSTPGSGLTPPSSKVPITTSTPASNPVGVGSRAAAAPLPAPQIPAPQTSTAIAMAVINTGSQPATAEPTSAAVQNEGRAAPRTTPFATEATRVATAGAGAATAQQSADHERKKELPLGVKVFIWRKEGASVGHASLATFEQSDASNASRKTRRYASFWPKLPDAGAYVNKVTEAVVEKAKGTLSNPSISLEEDIAKEHRPPDREVVIYGLDVLAIEAAYEAFEKSGCAWGLFGSVVVDREIAEKKVTNCSGLVFYLLMQGGLAKHLEVSDDPRRFIEGCAQKHNIVVGLQGENLKLSGKLAIGSAAGGIVAGLSLLFLSGPGAAVPLLFMGPMVAAALAQNSVRGVEDMITPGDIENLAVAVHNRISSKYRPHFDDHSPSP